MWVNQHASASHRRQHTPVGGVPASRCPPTRIDTHTRTRPRRTHPSGPACLVPSQAASCIDASQAFSGTLTIADSWFTHNGAGSSSLTLSAPPVAAFCSAGTDPAATCTVSITNTLFRSNLGQGVGDVSLGCDVLSACLFSLAGSNFTDLRSPADPGASGAASVVVVSVASTSVSVAVTDCTFSDNVGTGLQMTSVFPQLAAPASPVQVAGLAVLRTTFRGHAAFPGGLAALSVSGASTIDLVDCTWQGNSMGAVQASNVRGNVTLLNCTVADTTANPGTQGSVDIQMAGTPVPSNTVTVSLLDCLFANNTGFSEVGQQGLGGGGAVSIYTDAAPAYPLTVSVLVQSSSFTSNHGLPRLMAGALSVTNLSSLTVVNATCSGNQGGALLATGVSAVIVGSSTFRDNHNDGQPGGGTASPGGGAVSVVSPAGASVSVTLCAFVNNTALNSGGAVYGRSPGAATGATFTLEGNTFERCSSMSGNGGAVFLSEALSIQIVSNSFLACSAARSGGAVYLADSGLGNISASDFTGCAAGVLPDGGWPSSALAGSSVDSNLYQSGGGGVFSTAVQALTVLPYTSFESCSAVRGGGGGLHVRAAQVLTLPANCLFSKCSAAFGGGLSISSMHTNENQESQIFAANFTGGSLEAPGCSKPGRLSCLTSASEVRLNPFDSAWKSPC